MGPILQPKASQYRHIPDFFQSRQILKYNQILFLAFRAFSGLTGRTGECTLAGGGEGLGSDTPGNYQHAESDNKKGFLIRSRTQRRGYLKVGIRQAFPS